MSTVVCLGNCFSPLAAVRVCEFLVYSMWMRFLYLFLLLVTIGFVIPLLVLEFAFEDAEDGQGHLVAGTCHIEAGVRSNCMPESENINEVGAQTAT